MSETKRWICSAGMFRLAYRFFRMQTLNSKWMERIHVFGIRFIDLFDLFLSLLQLDNRVRFRGRKGDNWWIHCNASRAAAHTYTADFWSWPPNYFFCHFLSGLLQFNRHKEYSNSIRTNKIEKKRKFRRFFFLSFHFILIIHEFCILFLLFSCWLKFTNNAYTYDLLWQNRARFWTKCNS